MSISYRLDMNTELVVFEMSRRKAATRMRSQYTLQQINTRSDKSESASRQEENVKRSSPHDQKNSLLVCGISEANIDLPRRKFPSPDSEWKSTLLGLWIWCDGTMYRYDGIMHDPWSDLGYTLSDAILFSGKFVCFTGLNIGNPCMFRVDL